MTQKRVIIVLFLTLCLGGFLRVYKLGIASLWVDEAFVFFDIKTLTNFVNSDYSNPPLYVIFINIWAKLNNNELFLRLPSVFFALVTILSLYFIGKELFSKKERLLSGFLLAIAPFHIYYSQEVNKYTLLGLFGILSVFFLYKALQTPKFSFWLGYTIFTILAIFTQYGFLVVLFIQFLFVLSQLKKYNKTILQWLTSQILLFLVFLPWFPLWFSKMKSDFAKGLLFWSGPVNLKMLLNVFGYLYLGYNANLIIFVLGVILFSYLFFRGVFIYRHSGLMLYLTYLTIFPILIIWIISYYKPMFVYRFFMVSALLSYIIIACGILSFKRSLTKIFLVLLIVLMATYSLNNYYAAAFPLGISSQLGISARLDHRSLARFLATNFRPGDIICHNCAYTIPSLEYYLIDRFSTSNEFEIKKCLIIEVKQRRYLVFVKKEGVILYSVNREHWLDLLVGEFPCHKGLFLNEIGFNRMWLVIHPGDKEKEKEIINWANNNFEKDKEIEFHNVKLFLYLNPKET